MALLKENDDFPKVSLEEFDALPMDEQHLYELIDDMVLMTPRPNTLHQDILSEMITHLRNHFKGKTCCPFSELEVRLNKDIFVPDISILCDPEKFSEQRYEGAPTIAVEILSPGSMRTDLFVKLNKYQLAGVQEYWIVSPKSKTIIVHTFTKGAVNEYTLEDTLTSGIFEDLKIPLRDIFPKAPLPSADKIQDDDLKR